MKILFIYTSTQRSTIIARVWVQRSSTRVLVLESPQPASSKSQIANIDMNENLVDVYEYPTLEYRQ